MAEAFVLAVLSFPLSLFAATAAAAASVILDSDLSGQYRLFQILDETGQNIAIPDSMSGSHNIAEFDRFMMSLTKMAVEDITAAGIENDYHMTLHIGNNFQGDLLLLGPERAQREDEAVVVDEIGFGAFTSTMMMPPTEIYELESHIMDILLDSKRMEKNRTSDQVTFQGEKGAITFQHDEL